MLGKGFGCGNAAVGASCFLLCVFSAAACLTGFCPVSSSLQASLRHGCLCLTVSALLSPVELERLQREHPSGLAASVAGAVAKAKAASGTPDDARKLLVRGRRCCRLFNSGGSVRSCMEACR